MDKASAAWCLFLRVWTLSKWNSYKLGGHPVECFKIFVIVSSYFCASWQVSVIKLVPIEKSRKRRTAHITAIHSLWFLASFFPLSIGVQDKSPIWFTGRVYCFCSSVHLIPLSQTSLLMMIGEEVRWFSKIGNLVSWIFKCSVGFSWSAAKAVNNFDCSLLRWSLSGAEMHLKLVSKWRNITQTIWNERSSL